MPLRIADAPNMRQAFEVLCSYPTIGNFLAYQFITDINYSVMVNFSELEFVIPGPGALDGIPQMLLRSWRTERDGHHQVDHGPPRIGIRKIRVGFPRPWEIGLYS